MKASRVIAEMFYPSGIKCVICGDDLPKETRYCVCERCKLTFNTKFCVKCGRAMKNMADYCDFCQNEGFTFDMARAPFVYENEIVGLVRKLKFGAGKYLGEIMAQFMADVFYENNITADVITFVPLMKSRERKRGYNQSEVIASALKDILDIPLCNLLKRVKKTSTFARMGRRERAEAVKGAFALSGERSVKDLNILLIDDVFTTGSTAEECSRVLKEAGCGKISVLTFATSRIKIELY